ncbi:MAG TPA: clostripain-related cysteine peptidase [Pyrinomonadaceae bacterium]|nr:clostripain-related cysteine peptidase [Pyrinomonadaceae bacterium]
MAKNKATWTVMVYLAGDNNLTAECLFALTEMKKAVPGQHINVIAQFDPRDEHLPTHRYEINRHGSDTPLFDDIIDEARYNPRTREVEFKYESARAKALELKRAKRSAEVKRLLSNVDDLSTLLFVEEETRDDTDTGSPVTLYNFLSFCIEQYPAEHYLIALSGHAGGVETDYLLKDESSKGSLTFNELKEVFRELQNDLEGRPVDIVGMDNCLMSMTEICYELRGLVDIVVGCESFSPASGWPYRQILARIRTDLADDYSSGKALKLEAAKGIVEEYVNYYSPYWMSGMSVSQSALDLKHVEELRLHVDSLASALERELKKELEETGKGKGRTSSFKDNLVLAHWETQSYNGERFIDLFDFCNCLEKRWPFEPIAGRCQEMRRFISEEFVLKTCYSGAAYQYSYGVSIYFPWAQVLAKYKNLEFVQASNGEGWLSFIRTYTQVTRRAPRGFENVETDLNIRQSGISAPFRMVDDRMVDDRMVDDRMVDDRMVDDRMVDDRMVDDRMVDDRMVDDRMVDDRMVDDRMVDDRMVDDRMVDDRMVDDRMMSTEGNRVSSMRNPPVVFLPTDCIREEKRSRLAVNRFFGSPQSKRKGPAH